MRATFDATQGCAYNERMGQPVQTIEQTSKAWKAIMIGSVLAGCAGTGMLFHPPLAAEGALLMMAGLCALLFARFMAWWNHA